MICHNKKYIDIHTHSINHTDDVFSIVNLDINSGIPVKEKEHFYFSYGIHPWFIKTDKVDEEINYIKQTIDDPNLLALGETGIDKKCKTDLSIQEKVFTTHLNLAEKHNKPVIIHCVKAYDEILKMLSAYPSVKAVFHGFNKDLNQAKKITQQGHFISFGSFLSTKNQKIIESLKQIPSRFIFLETDNSSFSIKEIYTFASRIKDVSENRLQKIIRENFLTLF